jgi:hypothetical protein
MHAVAMMPADEVDDGQTGNAMQHEIDVRCRIRTLICGNLNQGMKQHAIVLNRHITG